MTQSYIRKPLPVAFNPMRNIEFVSHPQRGFGGDRIHSLWMAQRPSSTYCWYVEGFNQARVIRCNLSHSGCSFEYSKGGDGWFKVLLGVDGRQNGGHGIECPSGHGLSSRPLLLNAIEVLRSHMGVGYVVMGMEFMDLLYGRTPETKQLLVDVAAFIVIIDCISCVFLPSTWQANNISRFPLEG